MIATTIDQDQLAGLGQGGRCRVKVLVVIVSGQHLVRLSTVAVHCKVYSVDFGPGTLGPPTGATT